MISDKLKVIFSPDEINRIKVIEKDRQYLLVIADVHGLKCYQAKRFINNIINLIHSAFKLIIIHGYTHGTAIKDMLQSHFYNPHILELFPDFQNQGVTHMIIAA